MFRLPRPQRRHASKITCIECGLLLLCALVVAVAAWHASGLSGH